MKRLLALILILFLLPLYASAESAAGPSLDSLYPARDGKTGLWGYINDLGKWVIAPKWTGADAFAKNTARVYTGSKPTTIWYRNDYAYGLIDRQGNTILEPKYRIDQDGSLFLVHAPKEGDEWEWITGYYDAATGFYLEPAYDYIDNLSMEDSAQRLYAQKDGQYGLIDRATGQVVVPLDYNCSNDQIAYNEGYALTGIETETDDGFDTQYFLLNANGQPVRFPEGIMPCSGVHEGRVTITQAARADGQNPLYGFADTQGNVIVAPKYDYTEDYFREGFIAVRSGYLWGFIDRDGKEIIPPRYEMKEREYWYGFWFKNGYAVLELEEGRCVLLNTQGEEVFSHAAGDKGNGFSIPGSVMENGLLVYPKNGLYGLMRPDGTVVKEACYQEISDGDFSEGLLAAKLNDHWGYINESGTLAIAAIWDTAEPFENGLAMVTRYGKMGYINHDGETVYMQE